MATAIYFGVDNSTCKISGLSPDKFSSLRDLLSYTIDPQASYFSGNFRTKRYLIDKRGEFPSGLLYLVEDWIKNNSLNAIKKDNRKVPMPQEDLFTLSMGYSPYSDQIAAVEAAIASNRGGIIQMPTGSGKSITMALLIAALKVKTLVIVPNLELKRQLQETFITLFGSLNNVTVENIDSASLEKHTNYDCLIIDEAHHSAAKTYRRLNKKQWAGIYYRYCFTATPFRSRDEEQLLMESVTGQILYTLTYKDAVVRGYIVPIEAYYIDVPKSNTIGYSWAEVYKELIVDNKLRNNIIAALLKNLHSQKIATLCLVKEIAHGEALSKLTGAAFASGSNTDDCKQLISWFNSGQLSTLLGTMGVLAEGVDTKPAEFVIIAGLGKSRPAFMQQVGRCVRTYAGKTSGKVILFRDMSHKWTKAHFKAQCKTLLDEYGVKALKLEL